MQIQDNIDLSVSTELENLFEYSTIPIIITIILLGGLILFIFIPKRKKNKPIEIKASNKDNVKNKYLNMLDNLLDNINNKKISNRKAYQILSKIIRNFIYEMTNIKVQNCTLEDISEIDMPILYELISEYYDPEFANISKGNIISSLDKTKEVIKKWN